MKVKIDSVFDVSETTAKATGTVLDLGVGIEEHGHCWATSRHPDIENDGNYTENGDVTRAGAYTSNISGLEPETRYYIRAYIKNGGETRYSDEELDFTTSEAGITETLPVVTIGSVQGLSSTEATISGTIENLGTGVTSVSEHGHCWSSVTSTPTISDIKTTHGQKTSTGSFNSTLVSLTPGTKYYVRAYATNSVGTAYSDNIDFTTPTDITVPIVTTTEVTDVTNNTAVSGGNVISDGGAAVTAKGVCWNTSQNPTLLNTYTNDGAGTGIYVSNLTNLAVNATYYVRAYATNSVGTAYGEQKSFTTGSGAGWEPGDDWVDVRDGQEYGTVQIGDQVWMTENLNVGEQIMSWEFADWNTTIEKYCYDDNSSKCDEFGGLYTWYEMMGWEYMESIQGICPDGWHIPSDEEWITLEDYLGMDESEFYLYEWRGTDEGDKLKEGGSTGFDALMAGYCYIDGTFYSEGTYTYFWTTTPYDDDNAIYRGLQYNFGTILRYRSDPEHANSVRCIKD